MQCQGPLCMYVYVTASPASHMSLRSTRLMIAPDNQPKKTLAAKKRVSHKQAALHVVRPPVLTRQAEWKRSCPGKLTWFLRTYWVRRVPPVLPMRPAAPRPRVAADEPTSGLWNLMASSRSFSDLRLRMCLASLNMGSACGVWMTGGACNSVFLLGTM